MRATGHNLAALIVGALLTALVATSLSLTAQSENREVLHAKGAPLAAAITAQLDTLTPALSALAMRRDTGALADLTSGRRPTLQALTIDGAAEWNRNGALTYSVGSKGDFNRAARAGGVLLTLGYERRLREKSALKNALTPVQSAALAHANETFRDGPPPVVPLLLTPPSWVASDAAPGRQRIWLVARSPDGARLIGMRLSAPDAAGAGATAGPAVRFQTDETRIGRALADAATPLWGGEISAKIPLLSKDFGLHLEIAEYNAGIFALSRGQLVPALLIGGLVALSQIVLMRSERTRVERMSADRQTVLRNIALKQRELDASEARFKRLAESTNVVPWSANLDAQRFTYVGPQIEDVTGYAAASWYSNGFWSQHIHPEDRQRVLYDELAAMPHNAFHTLEYRIRAADGRVLYIRNMVSISRRPATAERAAEALAQGFMLDVTDMKRAKATLEEAHRRAVDANRVKSEFLANMSHELRTPLNAVIGFSEIMKDEVFGPMDPQYREYAESIHTSGRHLLDLINDVLDLSKIEAGRIELAEEETELAELVQNCVRLLEERITSAGLRREVAIDEALPAALVDERRIKQVLLNLISNAVKFTPPGGSIHVSARRSGDGGVTIGVRDTGVGMSPNEIPRAMEKFGQIDGELARKHDGTGLGLPIARSLIQLHDGDLSISSEKGKGTEVKIWLPPARMVASAAPDHGRGRGRDRARA